MDYAALLKPPPFIISKVGDPEQLLQDFTEYVKTFRKFVLATGVGGEHTVDHTACGACSKTKATLELVGGKVEAADTFEAAMRKIEKGIKAPEVYIPQMVQVSFPGTIPGVPVFFPDFFPRSTDILH